MTKLKAPSQLTFNIGPGDYVVPTYRKFGITYRLASATLARHGGIVAVYRVP